MKFKTIDALVRDLESQIGYAPGKGYVRLTRLALFVMRDLNLHILPNVRSTKVIIDANGTVTIPADVVEVLRAGVLQSDRQILPLRKMPRLYSPDEFQTYCCNEEESQAVSVEQSQLVFHNYYWNDKFVGEYYGWSRDQFPQGGYWHDERGNRLVFTSSGWAVAPGEEIIIEYNSTLDEADAKIVPIDAEAMIRYYVLEEFYGTTNPSLAAEYRRRKSQAIRRYNELKTNYDPEQVLNTLRGTYQTAKYE
jgi:hypothetical protein